jgi:hypothetical protein
MLPTTISFTNEDLDDIASEPRFEPFWSNLEHIGYWYPIQSPDIDTITCTITASLNEKGKYQGDGKMEGKIKHVSGCEREDKTFTVETTFNNDMINGDWTYIEYNKNGQFNIAQYASFENHELLALINFTKNSIEIIYNGKLRQTSTIMKETDITHILKNIMDTQPHPRFQQKLKYIQSFMYA